MKKIFITLSIIACLFVSCTKTPSVPSEHLATIETSGGHLKGTLFLPADTSKPVPVVLIIAGSGPTDRDCNSGMVRSDAYKLLAKALADSGIASFRYDKRGIGASNDFKIDERSIRFSDFVNDAIACVNFLKADKRFSKVIIAGHSEGSQIGMLACAQTSTDAFISICGTGRTIDLVLKEQLATLPEITKKISYGIIDSLKAGDTVKYVPSMVQGLFHASVQPYIISWMQLDPAPEMAALKIPSLIISGSADLQVSKEDALALSNANSSAELKIIEGMNHIFRTGLKSVDDNKASYSNPQIPISDELVKTVCAFVKKV